MRLIDADELKRKAQKVATDAWKMKLKGNVETILNQFIDWIDVSPTIEPTQKMGKWMQTETMNIYECSCCHSRWNVYYVCDFDYCPHCGAKMGRE